MLTLLWGRVMIHLITQHADSTTGRGHVVTICALCPWRRTVQLTPGAETQAQAARSAQRRRGDGGRRLYQAEGSGWCGRHAQIWWVHAVFVIRVRRAKRVLSLGDLT